MMEAMGREIQEVWERLYPDVKINVVEEVPDHLYRIPAVLDQDEVLMAGATLALLSERGWRVILDTGEVRHLMFVEDAVALLGELGTRVFRGDEDFDEDL